jgi:hypothetical protein
LLVVVKDPDGNLEAVEMSDLSLDEEIEFGAVLGGLLGLGAQGDAGALAGAEEGALAAMAGIHGMTVSNVRALGESLAPGAAAALLLLEHTWAIPLRDALRRLGAYPIAQGFLTPEAVMLVGAELQAMAEAAAAIELAETVKAAATLDALITVSQSQMVQEQAIAEAAEVVAATEAIKTAAVAEAVRTLLLADLIEQEAAAQAIDALAAAGLIEEAALAEATETANSAIDAPSGQQ